MLITIVITMLTIFIIITNYDNANDDSNNVADYY